MQAHIRPTSPSAGPHESYLTVARTLRGPDSAIETVPHVRSSGLSAMKITTSDGARVRRETWRAGHRPTQARTSRLGSLL